MLAMVLGAIFVIVFVISYRSLLEASWFGKPASVVLALCVATLSVAGLLRMGPAPSPETESTRVVFVPIFLPYAALALALVGLLVLAVLVRLFRRWCVKAERGNNENCVGEPRVCRSKPICNNVVEKNIRRFE